MTNLLLLGLGLAGALNGLVMLCWPEPWFTAIASDTGPFNAHLVRDVGAAYVTSGLASVFAARRPAWCTPLAAAAAGFLALHGWVHVQEVLTGAEPATKLLEDFPGVYLPALILTVIAIRSRTREA